MAAAFAASAAAQTVPRWFASVGDTGALAKWGIPETDAVGFQVICRDNGNLEMRPALFSIEKLDAAPAIRFEVDGEAYVRPGALGYSEIDAAWQAYTIVGRDDDLIGALRRGSELTYDFDPPLREGDAFTLPLSGSAKAIDEALDAC